MKLIDELKQGHMAKWTRAIRELKPADVEALTALPHAEYYEVAIKAAVKAGWFANGTKEADVDNLLPDEARILSDEIWSRYRATYMPDPN
jgi:hypothetical protein